MPVAPILALVGAIAFALGTVIQQREAMEVPDDEAMSAGFLIRLAKRPMWLAGIAADGLGFLCQAIALGLGRMIVVQPILATAVVFALPFGAKLSGQRVVRRDILAAVAVCIGLAAFLVVSDPSGGRDDGPIHLWVVVGGGLCLVSGLLAAIGVHTRPRAKAALFGTSEGLLFGLAAALTKAVVDSLGEGVVELLTDWHLYALVVVGFVSMTLSQISLQTGALAPAAATQMIFDPVASVILGLTLLDEQIHDDTLGALASVAALLVTFGGIAVLAGRESPAAANPSRAG